MFGPYVATQYNEYRKDKTPKTQKALCYFNN